MQEELMKKGDADFIVTRGRLEIVYSNGWWGDILMSMKTLIVNNEEDVKRIWRGNTPTMATDGRSLFVYEAYLRKLSFKQMLYVFLHESVHKATGHCIRLRRMQDKDIANFCADVVTNYICDEIAKTGLIQRPPGGVFLEEVYSMFAIPSGVHWSKLATDYSVEELYQMFVRKNGEDGSKIKKPGFGYIIEPTDENGNDLPQEVLDQMEVDQIVQTAGAIQRGGSSAGSSAGHIKELIERMRKPKVDWRLLTQEFITGGKPTRMTWARLNRRFRRFAKLPTPSKKQYGTLLVFRDTSGSVSDVWQETFLGFLNILSSKYDFKEIITVPVDYNVHEAGIQRFKSGERIKSSAVNGRGGTSFVHAFRWLDGRGDIKPDRIIYMTDLEGEFLPKPYKVPVLWVSNTNHKAPWGKTVRIEK